MSCRPFLLLASYLALGIAGSSIAQPNHNEQRDTCGYQDVVVVYNDATELVAACSALNELSAYFRAIGFEIAPFGSLEFAEQPAGHSASHGYFDRARARAVVYRSASVAPWGLSWNLTLTASFLRHELAHMMVWRVTKDSGRLPREWHEFIAYAIQLDLMDANVLDGILAGQPDVQPFDGLLAVNEFTYGMSPEAFAIAAYKTYRARGKAQLVQQLLAGKVVPAVSLPPH